MFQQDQFYLFLPSSTVANSDWKGRKANTLSEFRIKLPHKLSLTGEWECGLSEIHWPNTLLNVSNGKDFFFTASIDETNPPDNRISNSFTISCFLPAKNYTSEVEIADSLSEIYQDRLDEVEKLGQISPQGNKDLRIRFLYKFDRIKIKIDNPSLVSVTLSNPLLYMLGLKKNPEKLTTDTVADYPVDLHNGVFSLFVYCSILQSQIVGDCLAPLLKVVPIEGKWGEIVYRSFNPYQYLPLAQKQIDTVEIHIASEAGRVINFQFGKVLIVLHFRRRKTRFYDPALL